MTANELYFIGYIFGGILRGFIVAILVFVVAAFFIPIDLFFFYRGVL